MTNARDDCGCYDKPSLSVLVFSEDAHFSISFLKVGIFLLFLLATTAKMQVQGSEEKVLAMPYLDQAGNLCQDKLETMQDTEYETMIQARHPCSA